MLNLLKNTQFAGLNQKELIAKLQERAKSYATVDMLKKRMLMRVDSWTANKITSGLISDCTGYVVKYDSDRDTQDKLALALGLVNAGVLQKEYPQGFPCRGYKQLEDGTFETDKTIHLMNALAVIQWNTEFGEHLKKCTAEGWAKQAEVNACTTKEELEAVVL
jgi:hypothetical protein